MTARRGHFWLNLLCPDRVEAEADRERADADAALAAYARLGQITGGQSTTAPSNGYVFVNARDFADLFADQSDEWKTSFPNYYTAPSPDELNNLADGAGKARCRFVAEK